jgi:hypothetical protein
MTELRKPAATWLAMGRSSASAQVSQPDQLGQTLHTHQRAQLVIRAVSILCITRKMACSWQMLLGKLHGLHPCWSAAIRDGLVRSREVSSARGSIQGLLCGSGFDLRFNSRYFSKVSRLENISLGLVYNGFGTQTHLSLLLKISFPESCNESPSPAVFFPTEKLVGNGQDANVITTIYNPNPKQKKLSTEYNMWFSR